MSHDVPLKRLKYGRWLIGVPVTIMHNLIPICNLRSQLEYKGD